MPTTGATSGEGDSRRSNERRRAQAPFDGSDRRQRDRRSGDDRRGSPRISAE